MTNHKIVCIESNSESSINHSSLFLIEPLEVGHGITLGSAIRRTLLSDLGTYAISSMRLNNLRHEFMLLPSLREDSIEILLNLKEVILKPSVFALNQNKKLKGVINVKGPCIVTASMFLLPYNYIKVLNPNQYICTVTDNSTLYLEVDIEKGKPYQLFDDVRRQTPFMGMELSKMGHTLFTDGLFMPVKKVNFAVKYIHDSKGNIKERLSLEIVTNGSLTPERAFKESVKSLLDLFLPLLIDDIFHKVSTEVKSMENEDKSYKFINQN